MGLATWSKARSLAQMHLAAVGSRWRHSEGVAIRARFLAPVLLTTDQDLLLVAAALHDIGYAPDAVDRGLHQLDGAQFLHKQGYSLRLCALVAHHSAAVFEAQERGLLEQLQRWEQETTPVADALWTADMTTSPTGQPITYADRFDEIQSRHGPESLVGRAMSRAQPTIQAAIDRTHQRLHTAGLEHFI